MLSLARMQTSLQREQLTCVLPPSSQHTHSVPLANTLWFFKSPWRWTHQRHPLAGLTWSDHHDWNLFLLKQAAPLWAMTLQVTCLATTWRGVRRVRSGVGRGVCFFPSHTPAVVQFPSLSSGSSTPVSFRHVALALTSSPPSSPSSFFPRPIWAALAGPLTRMALIGEEQCVETC